MKEIFRVFISFAILGWIYFGGVTANTGDKIPDQIQLKDGRQVFLNAKSVQPLKVGQKIPDVDLKTSEGESVNLRNFVSEKPALLIFYRGGWCPYCTRHLAEIQGSISKIQDKGYQIVALTPDRPEKIKSFKEEKELSYTLLSDSQMNAGIAFGLAFQVPEKLVATYKEQYGIDMEGDSGKTHHLLPVPAAYLVNQNGVITFAYSNPDYKTRVPIPKLLEAL